MDIEDQASGVCATSRYSVIFIFPSFEGIFLYKSHCHARQCVFCSCLHQFPQFSTRSLFHPTVMHRTYRKWQQSNREAGALPLHFLGTKHTHQYRKSLLLAAFSLQILSILGTKHSMLLCTSDYLQHSNLPLGV